MTTCPQLSQQHGDVGRFGFQRRVHIRGNGHHEPDVGVADGIQLDGPFDLERGLLLRAEGACQQRG